MTQIFISYRHEDSAYICDRIYAALVKEFGRENIFYDISSISGGSNFRKWIEEEANNCTILLAVMGKRWLTLTDEYGQRRIDHPKDWVAYEIITALNRQIPVIPVVVEEIRMPDSAVLPPALNGLSEQQANKLRPGDDFDRDMANLIQTIYNWYPLETIGMPMVAHFKVQDVAIAHETIKVYKYPPDATQGISLSFEENDRLLAKIGRLLRIHPDFKRIEGNGLIEDAGIASFDPNDFQFSLIQERDNGKQILTISLSDRQSRILIDLPDWKLNILRFSRQNESIIDIYHNGDNSLPSPYREGSYGRNAPYSIVHFATRQFPELKSSDPNLVYLGSLPSNNDELTNDEFLDVRRRLAIYRFARWLWLWDHPLRPR